MQFQHESLTSAVSKACFECTGSCESIGFALPVGLGDFPNSEYNRRRPNRASSEKSSWEGGAVFDLTLPAGRDSLSAPAVV